MKNYLYIALILLCSCNKPLKITVLSDVSHGANTIIFDNKDTLVTSKSVDSVFLSPRHYHTFTINHSKSQNFFIYEKGGILNTIHKEFIVLQTAFETEEGEGSAGLFSFEIPQESYVLIDSFIVCKKLFQVGDSAKLKEIVDSISIRKNGNYKPPIDKRFPSETAEYDASTFVNGFKKIGNQELFVERFWDYDFGDSIPDKIKLRVRDSDLKYKNKVDKTFITYADSFLLFAKMSKKDYFVIDVRYLLRNHSGNHKKGR